MKLQQSLACVALVIQMDVCFGQTGPYQHLDEANRLISIGDCTGAEAYTRANIQRPIAYTVLGLVQLDCRRNKKAAIPYFKTAALDNESLATQMLIELGEPPMELRAAITAPPTAIKEYSLPQPPPYVSPARPQPEQQPQPQQIIIQQPPPTLIPGACIQDGGGLSCPNDPRTKIVPFKIR